MGEKEVCPFCHGKGWVENPDDKTKLRKCVCKIKEEMLAYLPNSIKTAKLNKKIRIETLRKNLRLEDISYNQFSSLLKTFLVKEYFGKKAEFAIEDGVGLIDWYVEGNLDIVESVPILILKLGRDTVNKALPNLLIRVLTKRLENPELITWVYFYDDDDEIKLEELYTRTVVTQIRQMFKKLSISKK